MQRNLLQLELCAEENHWIQRQELFMTVITACCLYYPYNFQCLKHFYLSIKLLFLAN